MEQKEIKELKMEVEIIDLNNQKNSCSDAMYAVDDEVILDRVLDDTARIIKVIDDFSYLVEIIGSEPPIQEVIFEHEIERLA